MNEWKLEMTHRILVVVVAGGGRDEGNVGVLRLRCATLPFFLFFTYGKN